MGDAELLEQFEAASLPKEVFGHREHVRVAWLFARKYGFPEALGRFADAIKRFAQVNGVPQLYHETITWAYLLLIRERMAREPMDNWEGFAAANGDLLTWKPSLLDRYYTPELLWSELARASFVMPDRIASTESATHGAEIAQTETQIPQNPVDLLNGLTIPRDGPWPPIRRPSFSS